MYLFGRSTFFQTYCTLVFNDFTKWFEKKGEKIKERKEKNNIRKKNHTTTTSSNF